MIHSVPATIIIMMKSKRFARIDLFRIVSISVIFTDELAEIFTLGSDIRLCKVIIMFPRFSLKNYNFYLNSVLNILRTK